MSKIRLNRADRKWEVMGTGRIYPGLAPLVSLLEGTRGLEAGLKAIG